jgi:hypothetical protein
MSEMSQHLVIFLAMLLILIMLLGVNFRWTLISTLGMFLALALLSMCAISLFVIL